MREFPFCGGLVAKAAFGGLNAVGHVVIGVHCDSIVGVRNEDGPVGNRLLEFSQLWENIVALQSVQFIAVPG